MQPARHQGCFCIVAKAKTVRDTAGDGNDVFHRPAERDAIHIGIRIDAEKRRIENIDDLAHQIRVVRSDDDRRWKFLNYFFCMAGTAQTADVLAHSLAEHLHHHLGQEQSAVLLDPLRCDHNGAIDAAKSQDLLENGADSFGGDGLDKKFSSLERRLKVGSELDAFIGLNFGKLGVFPFLLSVLANSGFAVHRTT